MKNNSDDMTPKDGRFVRFGLPTDEWLVRYALANDFKTVPELVRHIVREFKKTHSIEATKLEHAAAGRK